MSNAMNFLKGMFNRPTKQTKYPTSSNIVNIARGEIGVKEIRGSKHNSRVLEYQATTAGAYDNDEVPWCGSFVNWVMIQAGYKTTVDFPERAKAWLGFGVSAGGPTYGAIAVKSRKGGGHVGFVVGQSKSGKSLYILGGNQNNAVNIKRYPANVFIDYRIPKGYVTLSLPTMYNGKTAGSEA